MSYEQGIEVGAEAMRLAYEEGVGDGPAIFRVGVKAFLTDMDATVFTDEGDGVHIEGANGDRYLIIPLNDLPPGPQLRRTNEQNHQQVNDYEQGSIDKTIAFDRGIEKARHKYQLEFPCVCGPEYTDRELVSPWCENHTPIVADWIVEAFLSTQRDDWFCEKHGARGSVDRCRLKKFMPQIADCAMTGVWIVERETP